MAGFKMEIGKANSVVTTNYSQLMALSIIFVLLFGIFIALAMLHFILFLYYKSSKSNLYFSLFCLMLSLTFALPYLSKITNMPDVELTCGYLTFIIIGVSCFSFSSFINELLSRNRTRFIVVTVASAALIIAGFFDKNIAAIAGIALIAAVSLEAAVIIIIALVNKVPGARIIGTGILFFTVFILFLFGAAVVMDGFSINDSTITGQIIEFIMCSAILSIPVSMSAYLAWSFASINRHLKAKLEEVESLSKRNLEQEQEKKRMLENRKEELEKEVSLRTYEVMSQKHQIEQQHEELKAEKKKSDDLLLNILPAEVAEELKQKGTTEARQFECVTVLFTDFVDFTQAGEHMQAQELVNELDACFKAFDDIISKYNIEKIKTIGDAYLAVCGIPNPDSLHAVNVVRASIEISAFMQERKSRLGDGSFDVRIGIHSGPVVAGIVGIKKFAYDIWGDTVNTAARMEQHGEAGKINISQFTYELINDKFECKYRGEIEAKNKGALRMYFVEAEGNIVPTEG
jgi:class 3 adenylate cyclase